MSLRLELHPEAEAELAGAIDGYDEQWPGLGGDLLWEVNEKLKQITAGHLPGVTVPGLEGSP